MKNRFFFVTKRHRKFHPYAQLPHTKISYLLKNKHLRKDAAFLHFRLIESSENMIFPWNGNMRKLMKIWSFLPFSQIFVRRKFLFSCSVINYLRKFYLFSHSNCSHPSLDAVVYLFLSLKWWNSSILWSILSRYHSLYYCSQSLPLIAIRCHPFSLIVICCYSLYHLLSLSAIRCHLLYHLLSLVVTRCTTRLVFYKRSFFCAFHVVVVSFLTAKLEKHYLQVFVNPFNPSTPDVYWKTMNA